MKICILSQQKFKNKHVSQDTIFAFENAFLSYYNEVSIINISEFCFKVNRKLYKFIKNHNFLIDFISLRKIKRIKPDFVVIMSMSPGDLLHELPLLKRIPYSKAVYCIDTWATRVNQWKDILHKSGVNTVFLSNKASLTVFDKFIDNVFYLPYSMNQKWFYPRNLEKTHLFMQMGRKNESLNSFVLQYLDEKGLSDDNYIREKRRGEVIFPQFDQLAQEICKTIFFVLAPRDIEEGNVTGNISDVTARFYEGMACKSLLIGYKPKDTFDSLFPLKNAMIEIKDYKDFKDKVDYFLSHKNEYSKIVDDNYDYLIKHHTWDDRINTLINDLELIIGRR